MDSIERKSLLYKTDVEYGDYTINHVLGCSHGCLYPCYAFNIKKRFGIIKEYNDWLKPKIVSNALELLDKEIPKYKKDIKSVQLSFTTDPFMQGYPEVSELTIKIIKKNLYEYCYLDRSTKRKENIILHIGAFIKASNHDEIVLPILSI